MHTLQGTDTAGFLIEYGSGIVAGSVAFDTVGVGEPTITIQRQGIGLADATTNAFTSASCDGLFVSCIPSRPAQSMNAPKYSSPELLACISSLHKHAHVLEVRTLQGLYRLMWATQSKYPHLISC